MLMLLKGCQCEKTGWISTSISNFLCNRLKQMGKTLEGRHLTHAVIEPPLICSGCRRFSRPIAARTRRLPVSVTFCLSVTLFVMAHCWTAMGALQTQHCFLWAFSQHEVKDGCSSHCSLMSVWRNGRHNFTCPRRRRPIESA